MKKKRIAWGLITVLFVIALLAAGCGSTSKPAESPKGQGPSGTVMIYTSIYPDIIELIKPSIKNSFLILRFNGFKPELKK